MRLLFIGWIILFFQNPFLISQSFHISQYTQQEGLSFNMVTDILQDRYGFLWIATHHGLNKFDGQRIQHFRATLQDSTGLMANSIQNIKEDSIGNIWVNYEIGCLSRYNRATDKFEYFSFNKNDLNDPGNFVENVLPFDKEKIFCTNAYGLAFLNVDNQSIIQFKIKSRPDFIPQKIGKLSTGELWVSDFYRVFIVQHIDYEGHTIELQRNESINEDIWYFYTDYLNRFWVVTKEALFLFNALEKDFQKIELPKEIELTNMTQDADNNIYIGTQHNGIFRLGENSKFDPFHPDLKGIKNLNYLIGNRVSPHLFLSNSDNEYFLFNIKTDSLEQLDFKEKIRFRVFENSKDGIIWLGSVNNGLFQIEEKRNVFKMTALPKSVYNLFDLENWKEQTVLITGGERILKMDSLGNFEEWKTPSEEIQNFIKKWTFNIQFDGVNNLALTNNNKILLVDTDTWECQEITPTNHKNDDCKIYGSHMDRQGNIWMATSEGLSLRLKDQESVFQFFADGIDEYSMPAKNIRTLFEDKNGVIWLGILRVGLVKAELQIENGTPKIRFQKFPYLGYANSLNHIISDGENGLWIGGYTSGLLHFDLEKEAFKMIEDPELIGLRHIQGMVLKEDKLWISSIDGIHLYNTLTKKMQHFDASDGLDNYHFRMGVVLETKDNRMLFGRKNSFIELNEERQIQSVDPYDLVLSNFYLFGKKKYFETAPEAVREISLAHDENYVGFEIVKPQFSLKKSPEYAYQLEGLDDFWTRTTGESPIFYSNLPPGNYSLNIKVLNVNQSDNQSIKSWKVKIKKPFWKEGWFILLGIVASLGLIYFANWMMVKFRLREETTRNQIRQKAAADFHDEMGNKLARIALFTQVLAAKLENPTAPIKDYLQKIQENSHNLNASMRDFLWALDPTKDSLLDLTLLLKDFGDEIFDQTEIDFTVAGLEERFQDIRLNMDWKRHVVMIFKEGMTNILKHSKANAALLTFEKKEHKIKMTLTDNGIGFIEKNGEGLGIRNMKSRAEEIGGKLYILKNSPNGVCLELELILS